MLPVGVRWYTSSQEGLFFESALPATRGSDPPWFDERILADYEIQLKQRENLPMVINVRMPVSLVSGFNCVCFP